MPGHPAFRQAVAQALRKSPRRWPTYRPDRFGNTYGTTRPRRRPRRCTRSSCSARSEEHTSELQSLAYLVCRLLLEKKKKKKANTFDGSTTVARENMSTRGRAATASRTDTS